MYAYFIDFLVPTVYTEMHCVRVTILIYAYMLMDAAVMPHRVFGFL
jgi:hypothetical protein